MSDLTVKRILDDDKLSQIADKIVSGKIDNILIVYRNIETNTISWDTTSHAYNALIGSIEMVRQLRQR